MRFAGYAAIFGVADRGGDIIRPGAFADAVVAGPAGVPLLWQHRPGQPIGRIEALAEDETGLRVIGRLGDASATAREAAGLLREGALDGLSFGYRVRTARTNRQHTRELIALDLVEVSLVTLPMQPGARVIAIREDEA